MAVTGITQLEYLFVLILLLIMITSCKKIIMITPMLFNVLIFVYLFDSYGVYFISFSKDTSQKYLHV